METKSSALCLFDERAIQSDIRSNFSTPFYPKTNITPGAPIEFEINGTPDEYVDLAESRLQVKIKLVKTDATAWDKAADKVALINLPIASIFQDVFLTLGDMAVEGGQHMYPYNAYLSTLLNFHPSAKKVQLEAWGWQEDTPAKFDDMDTNDGFQIREAETTGGSSWEVSGPLFLDLTRQNRYILPQTNIRLKLLPAKADFALHAKTGNKYDFRIESCILHIHRVRVVDSVIAGHNKGLIKQNAKYPINHIEATSYTITKGSIWDNRDNLFVSQIPKFLVIGFVEHDAFNGNMQKSPFNFQHFDLKELALYIDGEITPDRILTPDYGNNAYTDVYNCTMNAQKYYNTDDSNGLTIEHFLDGYNLYAFDLTADGNCQADHRNLTKTGSLRITLKFGAALAKPINVVLYSVFDSKLEITRLRDVILSYAR